jgi:hypothetical protein
MDPGLERLIAVESVTFVSEQIDHCETHCIDHKDDEETMPAACRDGCRASDISVNLITEALHLLADADLGDWLMK